MFLPNNRYFSRYGFIGGHIEHVRGTLEGFLSNGFEVTLHTSPDISVIQEQFFISNRRVSIQPFSKKGGFVRHYLSFFSRLTSCVKSNENQIVYVRYSASAIPIIIYALMLRRLFCPQSRFILEVNSFVSNYRPSLFFIDRLFASFQFDMVMVSKVLESHWRLIRGKSSKVKTHIVPNGVINEKFLPLKTDYSSFDSFSYIGVLKPGYGIDEMLQSFLDCSFAKIKKMYIIGDGPERNRLMSKYKNENVVFLGAKWGAELWDFLNTEKTAFIYPGVQSFNFQSPVKLYDYLAFGAPIICCDQENAKSLLEGFKAHVICDINSPASFSAAIEKLMNVGSDLDFQVRFNQTRARKEFGWSKRIHVFLNGLED
jgi:glycosyltransferase involved in cell wall biosynthesis